jgi:hypothetical protein
MWETHFVILSVQGSIDLASRAEQTFAATELAQPAFNDPGPGGHILMSIDAELIAAMEEGQAAVTQLLANVESAHFANLEKTIVRTREDEPAS